MSRDLSPIALSNLISAGVGVTVGLALLAAPFVPWQIAAGTGVVIAAVSVVFLRSLLDPGFLAGGKRIAPWRDEDWRHVLASDPRSLADLAPAGEKRRLRDVSGDQTLTDLPVAEFLVSSRRAGVQ